jgi:hypothetical protein
MSILFNPTGYSKSPFKKSSLISRIQHKQFNCLFLYIGSTFSQVLPVMYDNTWIIDSRKGRLEEVVRFGGFHAHQI